MSLLKIENLTLEYLGAGSELPKKLVDNLSLEIFENEIFGLAGESGSGKTLTSLAILGLLPPGIKITSGKIFWQDAPLTGLAFRGRQISMVFQDPFSSFNPVMTIGRQIAEVLEFHFKMNRTEAAQKTLELLEQAHLLDPEKIFSRFPFELSGGQLQRAAIALALAGKPRLLIADEPTTALDVITQYMILELLKEVQKKSGISLMFISHDLALVRNLASRIAVMCQGRIVETGVVEEIFKNPKEPYTQKLISSIPVLRRF